MSEQKTLSEAQTKLLSALTEAKAPAWMMDRALDGCYDDYRSEFANPITALIQDSRRFGLADIAERAKKGDFDGTATDSLAWEHRIQTEDPETAQVLNMLKQK